MPVPMFVAVLFVAVGLFMGRKDAYDQPDPVPCGTCGGSGSQTTTHTDSKGNTRPVSGVCKGCGGSGKVFQ